MKKNLFFTSVLALQAVNLTHATHTPQTSGTHAPTQPASKDPAQSKTYEKASEKLQTSSTPVLVKPVAVSHNQNKPNIAHTPRVEFKDLYKTFTIEPGYFITKPLGTEVETMKERKEDATDIWCRQSNRMLADFSIEFKQSLGFLFEYGESWCNPQTKLGRFFYKTFFNSVAMPLMYALSTSYHEAGHGQAARAMGMNVYYLDNNRMDVGNNFFYLWGDLTLRAFWLRYNDEKVTGFPAATALHNAPLFMPKNAENFYNLKLLENVLEGQKELNDWNKEFAQLSKEEKEKVNQSLKDINSDPHFFSRAVYKSNLTQTQIQAQNQAIAIYKACYDQAKQGKYYVNEINDVELLKTINEFRKNEAYFSDSLSNIMDYATGCINSFEDRPLRIINNYKRETELLEIEQNYLNTLTLKVENNSYISNNPGYFNEILMWAKELKINTPLIWGVVTDPAKAEEEFQKLKEKLQLVLNNKKTDVENAFKHPLKVSKIAEKVRYPFLTPYAEVLISAAGVNNEAYLAKKAEDYIWYNRQAHTTLSLGTVLHKFAAGNYALSDKKSIEKLDDHGDINRVIYAYQKMDIDVTHYEIALFSGLSAAYSFIVSYLVQGSYLSQKSVIVEPAEFKGFRIPDVTFYLTSRGPSYEITSGYQYQEKIFFPFGVEMIIPTGYSRPLNFGETYEFNAGIRYYFHPHTYAHAETNFSSVGMGGSIYGGYDFKWKGWKFTSQIGYTLHDNRTLLGERQTLSHYDGNYSHEAWVKFGIVY